MLSYLRYYRKVFITVGIIFLLEVIIPIAIMFITGNNINFNSVYSMIGSDAVIIVMIPFITVFGVFPYMISMGKTRKEFSKEGFLFTCLVNIAIVLVLGVCLAINNALPVTLWEIGKFGVMFGSTFLGLSLLSFFLASIFYKNGFVYGVSSIFLILSPIVYFKEKISEFFYWGDYSVAMSLIILLAGVIVYGFSYQMLKSAEIKR